MGGDAPVGYDQVIDNKRLFIISTSVVAGVILGRIRFPNLESFEHFGARGAVSGRPFNSSLTGGPIGSLTIDGVTINRGGIVIVEKHIFRFDHDPTNDVVISRLKKIANKESLPEKYDLSHYTHGCREYQRYYNSGQEIGEPSGSDGYELRNNAHTATLENFKTKDTDLFHPDVKK